MPSVSVVIPAYNAEKWISQTIESVLAQDFKDYEIVVVNDGSTDCTKDIVSGYKDVYCIDKSNGGQASARNVGIRAAKGKYVAFLDADDLWAPHKLRLQMELIESSGTKWCYSDCYVLEDATGIIRCKLSQLRKLHRGNVLVPLYLGCFIGSPTPVVHRRIFDTVGYFDEDPRILRSEDWEMWLRIAAHFPVEFVNQPLAYYRDHYAGVTKQEDTLAALSRELYVVKKTCSQQMDKLAPVKNKAMAEVLINSGRILVKQGRIKDSRGVLHQAITLDKKRIDAFLYLIGLRLGKPFLLMAIQIIKKSRMIMCKLS